MHPLTRLFTLALVVFSLIAVVFVQSLTLTPAHPYKPCKFNKRMIGYMRGLADSPWASLPLKCNLEQRRTTFTSSVADNEGSSENRILRVVVPAVLGSLAGVMFVLSVRARAHRQNVK